MKKWIEWMIWKNEEFYLLNFYQIPKKHTQKISHQIIGSKMKNFQSREGNFVTKTTKK